MNEWKEYKLKDVANVKYGKAHQSLSDGYIPAYGSGGLIRYVEKALYNEESILIPRKGTLNNIIYKDEPFWTVDTMFWTELNKKIIVPKYLFYQLSLIDFSNMNVGSAVPSMTIPILNDIDIYVPSIPAQTAISSILSSLDDKIDLLHRQNATLEKLAETLFRQWFVEEAKEEWEMGKVSDYAIHFKDSIQPQKTPSTFYFHYSIPSFDNEKNPIKELGQEIQSNKYKVPEFCILFSKLNPHKDKRVWLLQNEVGANAACSTEFQIVLPKSKQHLYFLYGWLTLNENYNEIASGVGGTSGSHQRIDPNTIYNFQCPIFADDFIENINTQIKPLFQKQLTNQTQIRTLTALRDTLLPKLMSGEVRVEKIKY